MGRNQAYFRSVLRHKYFVFISGRKLGVPVLQLIIHDWDKFTPRMWKAYANNFYNEDGTGKHDGESLEFQITWNRHQKINKHHWQSWVLMNDDGGDPVILPMDENDLLEMVADWRGAGLAYGNTSTVSWYRERIGTRRLQLHPDTQKRVEQLLGIGIGTTG